MKYVFKYKTTTLNILQILIKRLRYLLTRTTFGKVLLIIEIIGISSLILLQGYTQLLMLLVFVFVLSGILVLVVRFKTKEAAEAVITIDSANNTLYQSYLGVKSEYSINKLQSMELWGDWIVIKTMPYPQPIFLYRRFIDKGNFDKLAEYFKKNLTK